MTPRRILLCLAAAGCSASTPPAAEPAAKKPISIITAERGSLGARLVAIDEHGDRRFELVRSSDSVVRDTHPVVSPDGRWLVFVSSRGRTLSETNLWIAPLAADAEAVPLTRGPAIDSHPVWTRDGSAIVFASTRDGGDFDLFRLAIVDGHPRGEAEQLTHGNGHEVTPAVAADGSIVYAAISPLAGGEIESHLELRAPDGSIERLTDGPADASPALSPDDRTIAFARPKQRDGSPDAELWTMPVHGRDVASPLVDLPLTDESGPVWSPDGRYVFATSVLRGAAGNPLFSSVIVIDTRGRPPRARLLQDRVGAAVRLTPAITRAPLDAGALESDPEYLPELARIVARAMAAQNQNP